MSRPRGRSTTCVIMEGYLTIPPERGTILGRALWKTRYVVIGSAQGEVNDGKSQTSISSDGITYLSIYKNPDDWEPVQQYAVSNITQCQVQMVAHRKQGPVLPTLILTIAPDPATEKIRKRRSSRAATLVSNKDNGPTTLWFRTDGEAYKLHEWARCIQASIQPSIPEDLPMSPMSPMTPVSPFFQNPFGTIPPRDAPDLSYTRPPSAPKTALHHKTSSSLYMSRERPVTISDSPSLRSRRSDLSSLTSSNPPASSTTQSYASALPSELPSPPLTAREPFGGFIEGWTSAQGRSSISNSPARPVRGSLGSGSVASNPPLSPAALLLDSGSPPPHRETILDRAFQMNYIPGSDQQIPGEEKLSSLARFEALMQQVDAQRRKQSLRPLSVAQQLELKSAWDLDDDSDDDDDSDAGSDGTEGESALEQDAEDEASSVQPGSRRAAEYPGGPQTPHQSPRGAAGPRSPIRFNSDTLAALSSGPDRPRFAHRAHSHTLSGLGTMTLGTAGRQQQQQGQQAAALESSPGKSSIVSGTTAASDESGGGLNPSSAYRTSTIAEGQQQRHSGASSSNGGKRLSFGEFTRRLSSTSSMLLVQSGGSAANSPHGGSDQAPDSQGQSRRSSGMQPRQPPAPSSSMYSSPPARGEAQDRAEKCKSWRSSVGMFGNEGGFL